MAVPSISDYNTWDGNVFNHPDFDANSQKTIDFLTTNYDVTFSTVTASEYVGIPSDQFSTITAGENLSAGDVVRISGGQAYKADNTSEAGVTAVVGVCNTTVSSGGTVKIDYGFYDGFSSLVAGTLYYLGTSGGITATKPSTYIVKLGVAVSTTRINFDIVSPRFTILDRRTYFSTGTGFNSNSTWIDVTPERISVSSPTLWPASKITSGEFVAYLMIEINGGGSSGDGFELQIIDDTGTTIWQSNGDVISNPGATTIRTHNWRLDTGNSTNLNIGTTPLYGITSDNSATTTRWTLQAKRTSGSSTSGTYIVRSVQFYLKEY